MSSAKSLNVDSKRSGRSFMYIRKRNGPKIGSFGPPASTADQFEHY